MTAAASTLLGTEPVPGEETGETDIANALIVSGSDRILALGEHAAYEIGAYLATRRRLHVARDVRPTVVSPDRPASGHLYSLDRTGDMPFAGTEMLKHDLATGAIERRSLGARRHPSGIAFVSDPARRGQDAGGWLVGLVHDDGTALTELVVLDANDFQAPLIARVHVTRRVPYGLHCTWAPASSAPGAPSGASGTPI